MTEKKKITWKKQSLEISELHKNEFLKGRLEKTRLTGRVDEIPQPRNLDVIPSFDLPQTELLIPVVEDVANPKEETIYLLKVAAEVEHALMIQYLYAAYSINDDNELKNTLINVAIQEMGHFLAVQNLLLSIGGLENLHLGKDEYRLSDNDSYNPLPLTLEPISKELLAKFVAVEAPLDIPDEFKEEVKNIHQFAKTNSKIKFHPVGGLYMKLFWLFQENDNSDNRIPMTPTNSLKAGWHITKNDFLSVEEIQKYEADFDQWDMSGRVGEHEITLSKVHNREDALNLIYLISAQGEGANHFEDAEIDTHFELFLKSYRNYNQTNVIKVPINPVSRPNAEYSSSIEIKNEYSLLWASLSNNLYTSLLLDIYSSMFYKQFDINISGKFIRLIFRSMNTIITSVSKIMLKLPLEGDHFFYDSDPRCAITFEIEPKFKLESDKTKVDMLNTTIINDIYRIVESIRNHSDFKNHIEQDEYGEAEGLLDQATTYCSNKNNLITINFT